MTDAAGSGPPLPPPGRHAPRLQPRGRPPRAGAGLIRRALQLLGFLAGAAILYWCFSRAFGDPAHRAQLARLLDAPPGLIIVLIALSLTALALDGLMFRAVLTPVAVLPRRTMLSVAGVCSALAYLPFKASLFFRFFQHHRGDCLPILTIGAWIAATGAVLLASLVPIVAATSLLPLDSAAWWTLVGLGIPVLAIIGHAAARLLASERGYDWLRRAASLVGLGHRTRALRNVHGGVRMLANPGALASALAFRCGVVALQAARFAVAGHIVGVEVTWAQALVAGAAYNLVQALSPGGVAGFREAGAAGALKVLNGPDILSAVLVVTIAEAIANLTSGVAGAIYLRVDRLLIAGREAAPNHPPPLAVGGAREVPIAAKAERVPERLNG